MPIETVRLQWVQEDLFLLHDHFGFPIVLSQPHGVSGADLLPLSLLGCVAWDIVRILHKMRQPVTGFRASAESTRQADPPWRFLKIHLRYTLLGQGLRPDKVQRAIELSETKYCAIYATLQPVVELSSEFEIVA